MLLKQRVVTVYLLSTFALIRHFETSSIIAALKLKEKILPSFLSTNNFVSRENNLFNFSGPGPNT